jgi:hypothetical protein
MNEKVNRRTPIIERRFHKLAPELFDQNCVYDSSLHRIIEQKRQLTDVDCIISSKNNVGANQDGNSSINM